MQDVVGADAGGGEHDRGGEGRAAGTGAWLRPSAVARKLDQLGPFAAMRARWATLKGFRAPRAC